MAMTERGGTDVPGQLRGPARCGIPDRGQAYRTGRGTSGSARADVRRRFLTLAYTDKGPQPRFLLPLRTAAAMILHQRLKDG